MNRRLTRISILDAMSGHHRGFRTAVSLHSHTRCSKEYIDFVPLYASRIPVVSSFFNRESGRYYRLLGKALDFSEWYWTPPLTGQTVFESETQRIKRQLGLQPLISLTDHDDISTAKLLHTPDPSPGVPISMEWTVPIDGVVLHLGIHNLPSDSSTAIVNELASYRVQPKDVRFAELLALLNDYPETLVVLNHPLSGPRSLGTGRLKTLIMEFLNRHRKRIHALELNGYRPWSENRAIVALAERFGLPIVSGGDRHGRTPNAVLNLTNAGTFSEFVSEIRRDKVSEVLVTPEYWRDLLARKLESIADFFRVYPEHPRGQQRWTDRVFVRLEDDVVRPLSNYWKSTAPTWVKSVMWLVCLVESKSLQTALRMAIPRKVRVRLSGEGRPWN